MSIKKPPDPDEVRRRPAYWAAVWCTRLAYVGAVAWVFTAFGRPASLPRFLPFIAAWVLSGSSLVLLGVAGVRYERRFTSWRIANSEIRRQFMRDLVWLPPR